MPTTESVLLEVQEPSKGGRLMDHVHTAIVLVAFLAAVAVRAFDPGAVSDGIVEILAGGVLGSAGTTVARSIR